MMCISVIDIGTFNFVMNFVRFQESKDSWFLESNGRKVQWDFFSDHKSNSTGSIPVPPNRNGIMGIKQEFSPRVRGTGTPKYRDEVNRREVCECDG
jgi:hypothetical protein